MGKQNFTKILLLLVIAISGFIGNTSTVIANDTISVSTDSCMASFSYYSDGAGTVYFSDSTWTDTPIISHQWDFGDDSTSTEKDPVHTYALGINKATVCLLVQTDSGSCSVCQQIIVRQPSETCTADFIYTTMLTADSSDFSPTYSFTDVSSGSSPITWRKWNFPDSVTYTDSTFVHSFGPSLSEATVCLTIGTVSGCQASVCKNITLKNCFADFSYTSNQSGTVNFFNQSQVALNAATWHWNFGDGTTSGQLNPVHTYASNISQANVCLTVKTSEDSCTVCKMIYIKNAGDSCHAEFIYNRIDSTSETSQYMFTDVSSAYSGIAWRTWSISDSTTYSDSSFVHTFNTSLGSATVCLSIGTNSGCSSTKCMDINLTDTVPYNYCKANFSYGIARDSISESIVSRYIVYFTNLSYSSGAIDYQQWSFGDGTYSEENNPTHIYSFAHDTTILVSLYIHSNTGCTDSTTQSIYIPGIQNLYSMSGVVEGKNELLPQGIIVLYKKSESGIYLLQDANIVNNGGFNFTQLNSGKYILYAIPDIYAASRYYPTYYVNKLHWEDANLIDLNSNIGGLSLKMVSIRSRDKGTGKISGTIIGSAEKSTSNGSNVNSLLSGISTQVDLYSPSGEILAMCMTDNNNNFSFDELPFGTYVLKIELLNLTDNATTVTLSPDMPEVNNIQLHPENTTGISEIKQQAELIIRNIDENNIAFRINQSGKYHISIVSLSGRIIKGGNITVESNTDNIISVGSIPKGIYILKAQSNTSTMISKFSR